MAHKKGMPDAHASHPNVTPLIDIIMCLIIFFMLVAKIGVDDGADHTIAIPATIYGAKVEDMGNALILNIRAGPPGTDEPLITALVPGKGKVELPLFDGMKKRSPLLDTLKLFRFGRDLKPGGTGENADNTEFKVIIRGDVGDEKGSRRPLEYGQLEPVLKACAEANVKNVNFQTKTVTQTAG